MDRSLITRAGMKQLHLFVRLISHIWAKKDVVTFMISWSQDFVSANFIRNHTLYFHVVITYWFLCIGLPACATYFKTFLERATAVSSQQASHTNVGETYYSITIILLSDRVSVLFLLFCIHAFINFCHTTGLFCLSSFFETALKQDFHYIRVQGCIA